MVTGPCCFSQAMIKDATSLYLDPLSGEALCDAKHTTEVVEITSSLTGAIWMDRNLGASQVATSSTDYRSYGCLYQWGRGNDGHASFKWTSSTTGTPVNGSTSTLSNRDTSDQGLFIESEGDWRSPKNDALWQGVSGINNPCPEGFRLPTSSELEVEIPNYVAAVDVMKFVLAGYRSYFNAELGNQGSYGYYWSSTVNGKYVNIRHYSIDGSYTNYFNRGQGFSVRCLKN